MSEAAANDMPACERCCHRAVLNYDVRLCKGCFARATAKLSVLQLDLLQRAKGATLPIALDHSEIAAANGLVARGLAGTRREGRTSSILAARAKYRKGSVRRMHLTCAGVMFVKSLDRGGT